MKAKLLICCLLVSFACKAQYPAPRNFTHYSEYITIDRATLCGGIPVWGPNDCSNFQWKAPDIPNEELQLIGYNVYWYPTREYEEGMEIPLSEVILIAHTDYTGGLYIIGRYDGLTWVTALYSDGESEPSNILIDIPDDFPIDIQNVVNQKFVLNYNRQLEGIEIKGIENIASVAVFRPDGTKIMFVSSFDSHFVTTKNLEKGVYIVQITTKDFQTISEKIIIE